MRLSRIYIESFRGIRDMTVEVDPVTVIIGENNHGKTSLFDLMELCLGRPGEGTPPRFQASDFHRPRNEPDTVLPIRAVLTFQRDPSTESASPYPDPLEEALVRDPDGTHRLHAEFVSRSAEGHIRGRFVDAAGEPLDPQPAATLFKLLRRLHPVLLVRFSDPHPTPAPPDDPWAAMPARSGDQEMEARIADVYRHLARSRGPVPTEELRRGLDAANHLHDRITREGTTPVGPLRRMLDRILPEPLEDDTPGGTTFEGAGAHTLGRLIVLGALLDVRGEASLPVDSDPLIVLEQPEVHLHPILLASTWDVIESLQAQVLVTTNSSELLSDVPLRYVRRLARNDGRIDVHRLDSGRLSPEELRRLGYHIRAKRGAALFARCWLFVEGETEFWLMRELARILGYDLDAEGVECIEFSHCGVAPLIKLADDLGIPWHLLADGDEPGKRYARQARKLLDGAVEAEKITRLRRPDVERLLWHEGYEDVYRAAAGLEPAARDRESRRPGSVIAKAVKAHSKPHLALTVVEACAHRGPEGVPAALRRVLDQAVRLAGDTAGGRGARAAPGDPTSTPPSGAAG